MEGLGSLGGLAVVVPLLKPIRSFIGNTGDTGGSFNLLIVMKKKTFRGVMPRSCARVAALFRQCCDAQA